MEIFLDDTSRTFSAPHDFVITFEIPDNIATFSIADSAFLTIQAKLKLQDNSLLRNRKPIFLNLRGSLSNEENIGFGSGELITAENLSPIPLMSNNEQWINLKFKFSSGYVAYIEERRTSRGIKSDVFLNLYLEGLIQVGSASTTDTNPENTYYSLAKTSSTIIPKIRIARSDWLDRLLVGFGYKVAQTFQLPDTETAGIPEEMTPAIDHLTAAKQLFLHEDYRASVNRCRQSLDAMLGTDTKRKTWVKDNLTSSLGNVKAGMIDQALFALNNINNSGSHSDRAIPDVEIDRDTAEYVIATLSVIFNYISRKQR